MTQRESANARWTFEQINVHRWLDKGKGEARVNVLSLNHQDDDFPGRGDNVLTGCQQVQENAKLGVLI